MLTETWAVAHLAVAITALVGGPSGSERPSPETTIGPDFSAATCDGIELKVVTEASDPEYSLATLLTQGAPSARLLRAGDSVGDARLVHVGYNGARMSPAVWLATPVSLCQALLFEPPARAPAPEEPRAKRPTRSLGASRLRVVPERENGSLVGLRLFGIQPNGLLALLGLQNGDRIDTINGFELASPEQALTAYARLRTASRLSVKLVRQGKPMTIDIHIR